MGSSIVHRAARRTCIRSGGKHLALQDKNFHMLWFRDERTLTLFLTCNKLKSKPQPDYLMVHFSSDVLGILCEVEVIHTLNRYLLHSKVLVMA